MIRVCASVFAIFMVSIGFAVEARAQECDCEGFKSNVGMCELGKSLGANKSEEPCTEGTARNMNLSAECKALCMADEKVEPPAPPPAPPPQSDDQPLPPAPPPQSDDQPLPPAPPPQSDDQPLPPAPPPQSDDQP